MKQADSTGSMIVDNSDEIRFTIEEYFEIRFFCILNSLCNFLDLSIGNSLEVRKINSWASRLSGNETYFIVDIVAP